MLSLVLLTSFGQYRCWIKNRIVADIYIGFQVDFERIKDSSTEQGHPGPFAGSFCLIWDHHNDTLIKPPAGKADHPYDEQWKEIVHLAKNQILVNV